MFQRPHPHIQRLEPSVVLLLQGVQPPVDLLLQGLILRRRCSSCCPLNCCPPRAWRPAAPETRRVGHAYPRGVRESPPAPARPPRLPRQGRRSIRPATPPIRSRAELRHKILLPVRGPPVGLLARRAFHSRQHSTIPRTWREPMEPHREATTWQAPGGRQFDDVSGHRQVRARGVYHDSDGEAVEQVARYVLDSDGSGLARREAKRAATTQ